MPSPIIDAVAADTWPPLPLDAWRDTYATLHMWTQVVGKLALGLSPLTNHYWNTALQITPRGLATLPLTVDGRIVTVTFDLVSHHLAVESSDGGHTKVSLEPQPVETRLRLYVDLLPYLGRDPGPIDRTAAWNSLVNLPAAEQWVPELLVPTYPSSA